MIPRGSHTRSHNASIMTSSEGRARCARPDVSGWRRIHVVRAARQGGSLFWKIAVVVSAAGLLGTIVLPLRQRQHIQTLRKTTHLHLIDLYLAEKFFYDARQTFTSDPESLLSYLNYARSVLVDTVDIGRYYVVGDTTLRDIDMWKIVGPRSRIRQVYRSPSDSSAYLLVVRGDGQSIVLKDPFGFGRIEDGRASWMEGRKVR